MMVEGEKFVEGGIFLGERVRPHRSSGENVRSLPVSSELLNILINVTPGRWWGGFFRGWSLSEEDVSSELLNMSFDVRPGRWWRGGIYPVGFSGEGGLFIP